MWSFGRDCTSYPWEISWHCHKKLYVLYTCSLLILLNVKFIQLPHYYVTSVHQGTFVSHSLGLQLSLREHTCASFIAQSKWWRKNLISLGLHDSLFSHSSLQFAHCLLCSHCFHSLLKFASSQWLSFPHSAYTSPGEPDLLSCSAAQLPPCFPNLPVSLTVWHIQLSFTDSATCSNTLHPHLYLLMNISFHSLLLFFLPKKRFLKMWLFHFSLLVTCQHKPAFLFHRYWLSAGFFLSLKQMG